MKLKVYNDSTNYTATVFSIKSLRPLDGMDNVLGTDIFGNQVLISKNTKVGDVGLYFPAETQIDFNFLSINNLYRNAEENEDTTKKGFFEANGRVKAIKMRGHQSCGFWIPIQSLTNMGFDISDLKVGDEFNELDDLKICRKYIATQKGSSYTPKTAGDKLARRFDRLVPNQFRLHENTSHLAKHLDSFRLDDIIVITAKWHGASWVVSNVLVNKQLRWYEKLLKKLGVDIVDKVYDNIYASRTVVKNRYINPEQSDGWYEEDLWSIIAQELSDKIDPGITLYGECVGFTPKGRYIQKLYDYGCKQYEHKNPVYRITYTSPIGDVYEFSWQQIKDYCQARGIEYVKEMFFGSLREYLNVIPVGYNWKDQLLDHLKGKFLEGDCPDCTNKVPFEGICIRRDGHQSYLTYKLKSFRFLEWETKQGDLNENNDI